MAAGAAVFNGELCDRAGGQYIGSPSGLARMRTYAAILSRPDDGLPDGSASGPSDVVYHRFISGADNAAAGRVAGLASGTGGSWRVVEVAHKLGRKTADCRTSICADPDCALAGSSGISVAALAERLETPFGEDGV